MFPCSAILLSVRLFPTCTQRFWLCPVDFRRPYFHCNKFSPSYAPLPVARKRQIQIQSVALFLCGHYGEYLDDVLYISKRGKPRTIKIECYLIITRMLARDRRALCKCQCLEFTKEEPEPVYEHQADEKHDYSHADEIVASLNLTENMTLALDYRMSGLSYPEIAKLLSRAVSTVYEYFEKMRVRYSAIYG